MRSAHPRAIELSQKLAKNILRQAGFSLPRALRICRDESAARELRAAAVAAALNGVIIVAGAQVLAMRLAAQTVIIVNVTSRNTSFWKAAIVYAIAVVLVSELGASIWSKAVWGYWVRRPVEDAALESASGIISITNLSCWGDGPPEQRTFATRELLAIYNALVQTKSIDRAAALTLTVTEFTTFNRKDLVHVAVIETRPAKRVYRRSEFVLAPPPAADRSSPPRLLSSRHYYTGHGMRWPQMFALIAAGVITLGLLLLTAGLLIQRAREHRYRGVRGFAVEPLSPGARARQSAPDGQ